MSWSLNEIESLARRAARGAGMSWGLAEEAGKAVRWLAAAGWPGGAALAALLAAEDGAEAETLRPDPADGRWRARGGLLCPIATGAALCDRAAALAMGGGMTLGPVAQPILLVPYMAWAADATGAQLRIAWPGATIARGRGETRAAFDGPAALAAARAEEVRIGAGAAPGGQAITQVWRGEIGEATAHALSEFARRTYAPATPESRLSGAGAGLTDND